ncbi:MAG: hypothetical protein UW32_C0001G0028 [Candidatus Wolfebacteria bacterium GW2011_GWE2_44_13]|uniref:Uncharacterized protein n=1 Tax=Candidatus Wolfebacteria bacterium GW2011_GWE2_44_13 TaxID=1619017 RepID=A0A0G1H7S1_9BACT|nr:MAG: hypothetical protein UW32_C0001G0028 [Candidatus Wolfebacteria bacterium GW2011_GWE2_44_13]
MQKIFGIFMALVISVLFTSLPAFAEWDPQIPTPEQTRAMLAPPSAGPEAPLPQNLIYQSGVNTSYDMDWARLQYLKALSQNNFETCQSLYKGNTILLLAGRIPTAHVSNLVFRELQADVFCLTAQAQALEYERLLDNLIPRYIRRME